jgi:hypothetical protein
VVEHFENVLPKSQAEVSIVLQRLIARRLSQRVRGKGLLWMQGPGSAAACLVALVTGLASLSPFFVYAFAWDWASWLRISGWEGMISGRQKKIRRGFPMCSICW